MQVFKYCAALTAIMVSLLASAGRPWASDMDERIEASAAKTYVFKTYLRGDDITVRSREGNVLLTGTVANESNRLLAKETVASLPGVHSVDNKLEIKGELPAAFSDAWLLAKVTTTLLLHRNVNAMGTNVTAKDGVIVLRGTAASAAQKDLTTEYVSDVEGVKQVSNEMTIAPGSVKPSGKSMGDAMDAVGDSIDDESITAQVKLALLYHRSTSALNTTVQTKDGVVSLGGKAMNAAEQDLAVKLAGDVRGVKRVLNNMTVAGG